MKVIFFLISLVVVFTSSQAQTDTTKKILSPQKIKISEPEFDGWVIYANDSVGKGIRLERQESESKSTSTIFGGMIDVVKTAVNNGTMYVKDCCSPIRITQRDSISFLVPYQDRIDPTEYIKIFQLTKEKKKRSVKAITAKYDPLNEDKDATIDDKNYIHFSYKKYGERSYLITIATLVPGEYGITVNTGAKLGTFHLFGVD